MNINELELRHLRGVLAVAEELNFGRAAERLHLSQPPLTRLVAEAEKALGAKLFARTTRRVALTPVGEVFAAEAAAVLARMDLTLKNVTSARDRQAGLLRLAYTPLALQSVLPSLLSRFREQDHDARIDLVELPASAQIEALTSGSIDFAFGGEQVNAAGVESRRLLRHPLALLLPEGHSLAERKWVELRALEGETLILHPRQEYPAYYERIAAACAASGARITIQERDAGQNCMGLVISGGGLLLVPADGKEQSYGLRQIAIKPGAALYAEIWASWLAENSAGHVKRLAEIVHAEAKNIGPMKENHTSRLGRPLSSLAGGAAAPPATPSTR